MTSTDPRSPGADREADGLHNAGVEHEHSDVDVSMVLKFGGGLFMTVVVCALIVWGVFRFLERAASARDPEISPVARPAGQLPPGPRLETNERGALATFRADEVKSLEGYGWVNQPGGIAHIPVAEAKKLLAQRGLPTRATAADPLEGTHAPATGESSGGRTIPSKPAAGPSAAAPPAEGAVPPAGASAPASAPAPAPAADTAGKK
jgi:hypothetical protein